MQHHKPIVCEIVFWTDKVLGMDRYGQDDLENSYVVVAKSPSRSMICPTISVYKGIVKEKPMAASAVKLKHVMQCKLTSQAIRRQCLLKRK